MTSSSKTITGNDPSILAPGMELLEEAASGKLPVALLQLTGKDCSFRELKGRTIRAQARQWLLDIDLNDTYDDVRSIDERASQMVQDAINHLAPATNWWLGRTSLAHDDLFDLSYNQMLAVCIARASSIECQPLDRWKVVQNLIGPEPKLALIQILFDQIHHTAKAQAEFDANFTAWVMVADRNLLKLTMQAAKRNADSDLEIAL